MQSKEPDRKYLHEFDPIAPEDPALKQGIVTLSVPSDTGVMRPRTIPFLALIPSQPKQIDKDFTSEDLINGKIRIEHSFGVYRKVFVWDETGNPVFPDRITSLDSTVVEIDLESFRLADMITTQTTWRLTLTP